MVIKLAELPDPQMLDPKSGKLTVIDFQKIKNHLLSEYGVAEPGRFSYYLDKDQEHFWRLISEKYPIPKGLKLDPVDKAGVIWERLMQEPSPRRFVELCQAIADHILYVSYWPVTEKHAPSKYGGDTHSIFLWEVRAAFAEHGYDNLIKSETSNLNSQMIGKIAYLGNDFGQTESERFITNMFKSPTVDAALLDASQRPLKKRWSWSKLGFKVKPPFAEISVEAEKK